MGKKAIYYNPRSKYPRRINAPKGDQKIPKHVSHGTSTCYTSYGCSCGQCLQWARDYGAQRRRNQGMAVREEPNPDSYYMRRKARLAKNLEISKKLGLVTS